MQRPFVLVILVWVPFLSIFGFASPVLTDALGDSHPHIAFHVLAPVLLVAALLSGRGMLRDAPTGTQRVLLRLLLVTVSVAVAGNLLELVAAVRRLADDGWRSLLTPDLFEEPGLHQLGASLTIPGLMSSMLLVLALALATVLQGRRSESV